ncbi:hypothetical protein FACS189498_0990 [Spirochaetia bacterium]|nr:hypothetical protein FACS189498_0990 [Spirochaetia bacterium]
MEDCRVGNWLAVFEGQMVYYGEEFQKMFLPTPPPRRAPRIAGSLAFAPHPAPSVEGKARG